MALCLGRVRAACQSKFKVRQFSKFGFGRALACESLQHNSKSNVFLAGCNWTYPCPWLRVELGPGLRMQRRSAARSTKTVAPPGNTAHIGRIRTASPVCNWAAEIFTAVVQMDKYSTMLAHWSPQWLIREREQISLKAGRLRLSFTSSH